MALSWNEIKSRAIEFSKEWKDDFNEHAEAKSFMDAFFNVFGIPRRRVATFEQTVKKEDGRQGFIDLLWKGTILIEFKSRGKNLEKAHQHNEFNFTRRTSWDFVESTILSIPNKDSFCTSHF